MNFYTQIMNIVGQGALAYISAYNMRDRQARPNTLAGLHLAEAGSVSLLQALRDRAKAEGDAWLAANLDQHAQDEMRHGRIFAHALKKRNKTVIDLSTVPVTTTEGTPDERRRSPFFEAYYEGYSRDDLASQAIDWVVFLASTHILELDASKDFVRMANALPTDNRLDANLRLSMLDVAADETRHAAYLREALERRLSPTQVEDVVDQWRTRKVNALLAMATSFFQKGGKMPSLVQDNVSTPASEPQRELVGHARSV
jgi:rubrerythrin